MAIKIFRTYAQNHNPFNYWVAHLVAIFYVTRSLFYRFIHLFVSSVVHLNRILKRIWQAQKWHCLTLCKIQIRNLYDHSRTCCTVLLFTIDCYRRIIVFSQCCLIGTHMYMTNNFDWSVTFARFFSVSKALLFTENYEYNDQSQFWATQWAFHGQYLFCNISILEVRRVSFSDSSITNGSELWVCGTFCWNFVQTIEFKNIPTILFGADTALHSIGLELYKFFPFDFQHFESLPFKKYIFSCSILKEGEEGQSLSQNRHLPSIFSRIQDEKIE